MGTEQSKPGPMVQIALDLGGKIVVDAPPLNLSLAPRPPGKPLGIINDGLDGHSLGSGIVAKSQKDPTKNILPL